jgi:hypothetical protein
MSTPPQGNRGWGRGPYGTSKWGTGITPIPSPPAIIPIAPLPNQTGVAQSSPICIRFTDNEQVSLATLKIAVGGIYYVFGGSAQNGGTIVADGNDENGFDIELKLPALMPLGSRQEVVVTVADLLGAVTEKVYFFSVGVGPRLISVSNPKPGVLAAHFNTPMKHDGAFLSPNTWKVNAVAEDAPPITITKVFVNASHASTAILHHEGGGSIYELLALGVVSQAGDPLELGQNNAIFELVFGAEADPDISLFDTIWGPLGISQRIRKRRTMDDHVVGRSIALGMNEQFRLRFQALDGTAGRDGRPGGNRT